MAEKYTTYLLFFLVELARTNYHFPTPDKVFLLYNIQEENSVTLENILYLTNKEA